MNRPWFLICWLCLPWMIAAADYPAVLPGYRIELPRDAGSHPQFRTEWWYVTGWIEDAEGRARGFQVTFFRSRPRPADENPSAFAPRQLLFAHAAISDPARGSLLHDQRSARAGFGLAEARVGRTEVFIDSWSLRQEGEGYRARIAAADFSLDLVLTPGQPPLLQGEGGYSRKGPDPASASYYYSVPQLAVRGSVGTMGDSSTVRGVAWLDHEWSSALMDEDAAGWDWVGINLDDGGALMAFRMRDAQGGQLWAGGTLQPGGAESPMRFGPDGISWQALKQWRSPRTGVDYPVEWRVRLGERQLALRPLMDDQESDSRRSTGVLYWEGAVEALDENGRRIGRGYLELTGYGSRLRL